MAAARKLEAAPAPAPETEVEQTEETETAEEEQEETPTNSPSRAMVLQKALSKIIGLLERTLHEDDEMKRRVIRAAAALLGEP